MSAPRIVLVLSETWTMTSPRDLRALVGMAREAEDAGIDAVMLSEHVVLGPSANAAGEMANPREYALPGNQDPAMPWPSSIVLLAAMAAVTSRLRLAAVAIIAPLRHPLLIAKELATLDLLAEGRLVVQPTVSWHPDEYAALGVPFTRRGRLLDEHLEVWRRAWSDGPLTGDGPAYPFAEVYLEPKPHRPEGPALWFGGESLHDALLRRLIAHGSGFHPLGQPSDEDLRRLRDGLVGAGRDPAQIEMVGGARARFPSPGAVADIGEALDALPDQMARGFTTFCVKPSQFIDDARELGAFCRDVVARVERL